MKYLPSIKEKSLFKAVLALQTQEECKKFLRDLLTEGELKEFANRWLTAQLLHKKVPYETIEKETGMSSTTVARISNWLNTGMGGYKLMLERLQNTYA